MAWFQGLVAGELAALGANVPIVVSCTSIPTLFTGFDGLKRVPFSNRQLVDQLARQTNRGNIIFGDWGSTRPRVEPGFANRPLDRIDYPMKNSWCFSRKNDGTWDFQMAAANLLGDEEIWNGHLQIWGEEQIIETARNQDIGIDSPQKNISARVNIHLHLQAFYDTPDLGSLNLDEDWQDE
jgi:hypothetical protein